MKVPDSIIKIKDLGLIEVLDSIQTILNNGLYEIRLFGAVPDWEANEGENGIYVSGDVRQMYFRMGSIWTTLGFNSLGTLTLFDKDGDTGITPEYSANENIIRFYTFGLYNFAMGTFGFALAPGLPVVFNGSDGETKWVYDTVTNYLTGYTNGVKRIEM